MSELYLPNILIFLKDKSLRHLIYLQNPGSTARSETWPRLILPLTRDKGSYIRVFAADFNGDGVVDGVDLAALLANWGMPGFTDLNDDGTTDGADLASLLANWTP